MKLKTLSSALVLILLGSVNLLAVNLNSGRSGEQLFNINPAVGPIELKFNSSAPLEDIVGTVKPEKAGSWMQLNHNDVTKSTGRVTFNVSDIETGIKTRDQHLQSPDWLDAGKYNEITFDLKEIKDAKISSNEGNKITVTGNATGIYSMHGKTKNITSPITITYMKSSQASAARAAGDWVSAEGKFELALKDFGVKGSKGIVGSKVGEVIQISYKLYYNSSN